MPARKAKAIWKGELMGGTGSMSLGSGAFEGKYSVGSRFESDPGTNPEELIGAAHAGCFSMAFSAVLGEAGFKPRSIHTDATVHVEKIDGNWTITAIDLSTVADIPGIGEGDFQNHAMTAKENCPVSRALAGPKINLRAKLA